MFVFLYTCQWPTRYELFVFLEMAVHCNCRPLLGVVVVVGPGAGVGGATLCSFITCNQNSEREDPTTA